MVTLAVAIALQIPYKPVPSDDEGQQARIAKLPTRDRVAATVMCIRQKIDQRKGSPSSYNLGIDSDIFDAVVAQLHDLHKKFPRNSDYRQKRGYFDARVEDVIDSTHVILTFREGGNGMLKSALAEKSKGKWRFLSSSFPSDAANQIRSSALAYLRGRFFDKGIKSYLGVHEDPPYLSLHFGNRGQDAPAPWLRAWGKDGYIVLPISKEPKEVTPHGYRSLTVSQVQRIDDGRALMQIEVRDTFGKDYGFLDVIGDMSHWAFLLATKRGKTWTFETRAWSYFPLE